MAEPYVWSSRSTVSDLTGQMLVASPHLEDPHFAKSVVYVLEHSPNGALGVVLNRPSTTDVNQVLPQWRHSLGEQDCLFKGGPVGTNCALGLAIAAGSAQPLGWQPISGSIGLQDLDTPQELVAAQLQGMRIFAGYAGWESGQLEDEITDDAWFVVDAYPQDIVAANASGLWRSILRRQRNDLVYLSTYVDDPTLN